MPGPACRRPTRSDSSAMLRHVDYVLNKLDWMRTERIWPNGLRYLWTDAFGLVLYVSLYRELREECWLVERISAAPPAIVQETLHHDLRDLGYRDVVGR